MHHHKQLLAFSSTNPFRSLYSQSIWEHTTELKKLYFFGICPWFLCEWYAFTAFSSNAKVNTCALSSFKRCWSWWCSAGGAAARSAAAGPRAAATGPTWTGGSQGATHNLREWSNLKTAVCSLKPHSGWWFYHFIHTTASDPFQRQF